MAQILRANETPNAAANEELARRGIKLRMIYGANTSAQIMEAPGGAHANSHKHDCEQFDYILSGEKWFFIGESGFLAKEGDFVRIPAMAIHWNWNRSSEPCTVIEFHTPGMQKDPILAASAVPLLEEGEQAGLNGSPRMIPVSAVESRMLEIEQKVIGAYEAATADASSRA